MLVRNPEPTTSAESSLYLCGNFPDRSQSRGGGSKRVNRFAGFQVGTPKMDGEEKQKGLESGNRPETEKHISLNYLPQPSATAVSPAMLVPTRLDPSQAGTLGAGR